MKSNKFVVRGFSFGAAVCAAALCGACSDGSKTSVPTQGLTQGGPRAVNSIESAPVVISQDAGGEWVPDFSWAVAVPMSPWTQCTVYPEGASNDPTRTELLQGTADSEVRFYGPPPSWGTKLTLDCVSQGQHSVDLNDTSTFTRRSGADLDAKIVGTQPALTGDPSTMSPDDFLQQGFMLPPNPTTQPKEYSRWLKSVSQPTTIRKLVLVATLGMHGAGAAPQGVCNNTNDKNGIPWSGIIQAAAGFNPTPTRCANTNNPTGASQFYEAYEVFTTIPFSTCAGGCLSFVWGGIGGYPAGGVPNSLIQSGFALKGTNSVHAYLEFINASGQGAPFTPALPSGWNSGDDIAFVGEAVTSSACTNIGTAAPWACFEWADATVGQRSAIVTLQNPGGMWLPATTEYVVEIPAPTSQGNPNYGIIPMLGFGVDWNNAVHADPGNASGTDPYEVNEQLGVNGVRNYVYWANGSQNSSLDPINFAWFSP